MSGRDLKLKIESEKYINSLDINGFSSMLNNPSFSYKFYWLEALVNLIDEDVAETTLSEIIDEMIANAWYSVVEFHIHLSGIVEGVYRDGIEQAINVLRDLSGLKSNASKVEIKNAIKDYDKELKPYKSRLTQMVPYRALSGFFGREESSPSWENKTRLIAYIEMVNRHNFLPYTFGTESGLGKKVYINPIWKQIIQDNSVQILGWIQYEKVKWLQNNNPEVPGLIYKLKALDDSARKLNKVHDMWDAIMESREVRDVFTEEVINGSSYDIDHFIPWSYVMNDELWNLSPMDSNLNSSKNNRLPEWERFFANFYENQYLMYEEINKSEQIHSLYEKCFKDNLHSIWASEELYRKGNNKEVFKSILEKNMRPVYDSAKRQGYQVWKY